MPRRKCSDPLAGYKYYGLVRDMAMSRASDREYMRRLGRMPINPNPPKGSTCIAAIPRRKRRRVSRAMEEGRRYYEKNTDDGAPFIPTPEEIAKAAAAIRATWSERERQSRCMIPGPVPFEMPVYRDRR